MDLNHLPGPFHTELLPEVQERNGHLLVLGGLDWRCQNCDHSFDAAIDADLFACGTPCQH